MIQESKFKRRRLESPIDVLHSALAMEDAKYANEDFVLLRELEAQNSSRRLNHVWRESVSSWCYDVVDAIGVRRDAVYEAMSIIDRYLAKASSHLINEVVVQCTSMAALYLAIQRTSKRDISLTRIVSLKRGTVHEESVEKIIRHMIKVLAWDPCPSPTGFVKIMVNCLPCRVNTESKTLITETATAFAELATCLPKLSSTKPSIIAYASILNAISEFTSYPDVSELQELMTSMCQPRDISKVRIQLFELLNRPGNDPVLVEMQSRNLRESTKQASIPHVVSQEKM